MNKTQQEGYRKVELEEIKEGQYLYYTERSCAPFKGGSPDHADSLFRASKAFGVLKMHLVCGNVDGSYRNFEDLLGGSINKPIFASERWFLTDFPGGDAAEWMSRNYPLNGQAVKEEPKEPTITITEKEYRDLCRSADTLEWLADRGVCWRGVDTAFPGWRVGEVTEWHYANNGDVRDMVDDHRDVLRHQKDRD